MISLNRRDIDRLIVSVVIAVLIHLFLFFVLPLIVRLRAEELPAYSGPVFVNLEETPSLGKTVVKEVKKKKTLEKTPIVKRVVKKAPVKVPVERGAKKLVSKEVEKESMPAVKKMPGEIANAMQPTPGITPPRAATAGKEVPLPYSGEQKESMAPKTRLNSKPAFPQSGNVYNNENPMESVGTNEKSGGKSENLTLSKSIYSRLDKLLKEKKTEGAPGGNRGEIANSKQGNQVSSETGEQTYFGPNIQWEEPSQRRIPISMPFPRVPKWVERQGLTLKVTVSFELLPEGIVRSLKIIDSSGYSDVDSAVVEALRHWRFEAISGTKVVRGKITYIIKPKG